VKLKYWLMALLAFATRTACAAPIQTICLSGRVAPKWRHSYSWCFMPATLKHRRTPEPAPRARISARVPRSVQTRLEEAAERSGATVNQFVVQAAIEKAEALLERERVTVLSARDAQRLVELLDNPPPPNEKLKRGLEMYRRATGGDPHRAFKWPPRSQDV
jgi:uncharacterized protein (DUF1778 family)